MRVLRSVLALSLVAGLVGCGPEAVGPLLVRGEVRDSGRKPVPDTRVLLLAYESGDAVPNDAETPIFSAETRTAGDGSFEFRVAPTVELRALADRHDGVITFNLASVLSTGDVARWGFPRRLRGDQWAGDVPRVVVEPLGAIFD